LHEAEGDRTRLAAKTVASTRRAGAMPPYTFFRGLYERQAQHNAQPPYTIVPSWMQKQAVLSPDTPFNFVSTADIVGGNSGSPVVNRAGEVVGLIFDGNIQSLPGYFVYDAAVNRAVAVDSARERANITHAVTDETGKTLTCAETRLRLSLQVSGSRALIDSLNAP
jgi:hypothetical protein